MGMTHFSMPNSIPISWLYIHIVCINVTNSFWFFANVIIIIIEFFKPTLADGLPLTAILFKSPRIFTIFTFLIMLLCLWYRLVFKFSILSAPLSSFWGSFRVHQLHLVSPSPSCIIIIIFTLCKLFKPVLTLFNLFIFTKVRVTASLLRSPWLFWVF